ncbi:SWIM zinc finger family protein [Nonomuraea sp. NPDC050404]|uniref:SWIM zinc finger family protein n=1 Tax=Nonomuraea sp. NPDC050404 TaxID=3155783 RepID=UPI0033F5DFEB
MIERWSRDQVLALAPDASSQKAAQGVSGAGKWSVRGTTGTVLYGECKGSGSKPYLAAVDLTEPAYRCSCPSRKFPCKHALGLLLLWSADGVPVREAAPQWVTEWMEGRAERAEKSAARLDAARAKAAASQPPNPSDPSDPSDALDPSDPNLDCDSALAGSGPQPDTDPRAAQPGVGSGAARPDSGSGADQPDTGSRAAQPGSGGSGPAVAGRGSEATAGTAGGPVGAESVRHGRVAAGLAELERWLADQLRQGLAGAAEHDWDGLAKRLIDAQAPGVAGIVSRLARVRAEEGWPGRLLEEYALINLLAIAYRRRAELPERLAQSVLIRVGFPITREEVLVGPPVRDHWDVLGRRDEAQDRLTARRVWLRGRRTGRPALILSFAPQGQPLDASLVTGTTIDADLTYYPGAAPLRALVATRHAPATATPATATPATRTATTATTATASTTTPTSTNPTAPTTATAPTTPTPTTPTPTAPTATLGTPPGALPTAPPGASPPVARPATSPAVPPGVSADEALDEVARALGEDPWTESWPLVLAGVVPGRTSIGGLPLHPRAHDLWRLLAVSGGHPLTVAVEWTPQGLRPLTTWDDDGRAVIL